LLSVAQQVKLANFAEVEAFVLVASQRGFSARFLQAAAQPIMMWKNHIGPFTHADSQLFDI
jgi:hypothetical protein